MDVPQDSASPKPHAPFNVEAALTQLSERSGTEASGSGSAGVSDPESDIDILEHVLVELTSQLDRARETRS